MAKLSPQRKETIKTISVIIILILLLITYVIYPLNNSDTLFSRADIETYNVDSLPSNEFGLYTNPKWLVDTFRVEPDGLTSLACLSITDTTLDSIIGTVLLISSTDTTRITQLPLIEKLTQSSYTCITYDQRATGLSTGKYHGFGFLEASDLQELISSLEIHSQLVAPLYVIGEGLGADAALFCALDESRIKKVVAIDPYLTTDHIIETAKLKHNSNWFPFYNSVMYWWYDKNAGYAPPYRELENMQSVSCQTLLLTNNRDEATEMLMTLSDKSFLTVQNNNNERLSVIINFLQ